jgi:Asp-tRNA(Asn)/Glu-tRNA(Gln) amidotransferase C subunit
MNHANGMNGGMGAAGGMVGFPTPAGHQSDLNYIMQMVEDLSRQLETNQRITSNVMENIGKVRDRAKTMDLSNDELIALVASEMNGRSFLIEAPIRC